MHRENVTFVFQCKFAYLIVKGARERREVVSKERGPKGSLENPLLPCSASLLCDTNPSNSGIASPFSGCFSQLNDVSQGMGAENSAHSDSFATVEMICIPRGRQTPQPSDASLRSRGVGLSTKNVTFFCRS
ncbi:GDSL esterase/lipase [Dissostichus eleginoides]|uniref:GDSL esterase/lipase n=1 Tax=Dissostichus eleginoides TaxID=100907 RepID=A0AAD9C9P5_DISEL|nr:GDSL esterase/lipase [Dissostichus eleginoides]